MPLPLIGFFTGGLFAKVLAFVLAGTVVRVATAMGIGLVAYTGINLATDALETFVNNSVNQIDSYTVDMLQISGFMFTIEIILSTIVGILAVKALTSAKRLVFK